jgi:hypothetical protein
VLHDNIVKKMMEDYHMLLISDEKVFCS